MEGTEITEKPKSRCCNWIYRNEHILRLLLISYLSVYSMISVVKGSFPLCLCASVVQSLRRYVLPSLQHTRGDFFL